MRGIFLIVVLLSCMAETRGAWLTSPFMATKQSVRYALQASGNGAFALSGQVLPQGILGDFREASVNKIPWKGPGAVGFKEPEAIREMTVIDRSSSLMEVAEEKQAPKQQQGGSKEGLHSATEPVVTQTKEAVDSTRNELELAKPSEARTSRIERIPFFLKKDPGYMSPDVIASVRINEQQYQLSPSINGASIESSNRKARDAAILRFESSSWAAENLKSEKASADVLTRVNIGIGAPIARPSPVAYTNNKQTTPRVEGNLKGAQDWTSENAVKPSKESADVLFKVQIHDEIANIPASQRVQTPNIPTAPDQPDVLEKVNINEGSVAKNLSAAAKPTKESADVQTPVKIHEDVKLTEVAKPSKESADVQTSVKIHKNEMPSQTAKPAKESADVLSSVKINPDTKAEVNSAPSVATEMQGDKQDIVKPFDKSNSQPPIVEPILLDKLPKSNYKNDLDDIITVESNNDDEKTSASNETEDIFSKSPSADDKVAPVVNKPSDLNQPEEIQAKAEQIPAAKKLEESAEVSDSVRNTKVAKPVSIAKPYKESADVLTPVKIHAEAKATKFAKPSKESADVLTPVKIHAGEKPSQIAKPVKDSADVQTPVKIHAIEKPPQIAKPVKDSADVQTPVKIHEDVKPAQRGTPIKDSADVQTPVKIHADVKPVQIAKPVKDSADVQTPVKIHADTKPAQIARPVKDSADVQTPIKIHAPAQIAADVLTPVKIHADTKPTSLPRPSKASADVLTPVKIHADTKPTQRFKPVKDSADVLTPVKLHADGKPPQRGAPMKDSADVQTPVKIHEDMKPTSVAQDPSAPKSSTLNGAKDTVPMKTSIISDADKNEPVKTDKRPSKNGEKGAVRNTDVTVGGVQNDSMKDIFASLVAADVITGVKMYGDRIAAPSASDSTSSSSSKWKSDFDPNRWAPITY